MKLEEFIAYNKPSKQRSRLDPFADSIFKLREEGYSLRQICEFLSKNSVAISKQALSEYIKRRQNCATQKPTASGAVNKKPNITPSQDDAPAKATVGISKINTPEDIRRVRRQEINIDDYAQ